MTCDLDRFRDLIDAIEAEQIGVMRIRRQSELIDVLPGVLAERDELITGLEYSDGLIDQERERLGVGPSDPEPQDERYQGAVDQWLVWLARYEAIEEALDRCKRAGVFDEAPTPKPTTRLTISTPTLPTISLLAGR